MSMTRAVANSAAALVASVVVASSCAAQQPVVTRHRTVVVDLAGRPVPNARVRLANGRVVLTDARGTALIDSLSLGKQVLDISAIGYTPEQRILDVRAGAGSIPTDTVVLERLESLDTARIVIAGAVGFDARRNGPIGQFITAADIEREQPRNTIALLRPREGMKFTIDRGGNPSIEMNGGDKGRTCKPMVLIDGFPPPPTNTTITGLGYLNRVMHLDEIGGVELYTNPATIPPQFAIRGNRACGAMVFWTRAKLNLPPASPSLQKP